ncbi:hypothetical protein VT06_08275 [Arsukibacterium sp. MJ3]|nr:hypothetical protein VT06_08275 [Arsukibacterium sp. MJ3]
MTKGAVTKRQSTHECEPGRPAIMRRLNSSPLLIRFLAFIALPMAVASFYVLQYLHKSLPPEVVVLKHEQ